MPFFGGSGDYHIVGTNVKGGTDAAPAVIGDNNIALGNASLQNIVNSDGNVGIGNDAGNTLEAGNFNVFIGYQAGRNIPTNSGLNVLIGHWAGGTNPSSVAAELQDSVFIGAESGYSPGGVDEIKNQCIGIGTGALRFDIVGPFDCSGTVAIGYQAGLTDLGDVSNSVYIGQGVTPTGPNEIIIGDSSQTAIIIGGIDFSGGPGFSLPYSGSAGALIADTKTFANSVTWNNAAVTFTGWQLNVTDTASNAASLLMDLRVGGVSKANVSKAGLLTAQQLTISGSGSSATFGGSIGLVGNVTFGNGFASVQSDGTTRKLTILQNNAATEALVLQPGSAVQVEQRNGTNAQTFRLYNTYADASNYERASFTWSGNICYLKPEAAGTGVSRPLITVHGSTTVAGLPAASSSLIGARCFVTDSNAALAAGIGNIVATGGANFVPVYCDGTNWRIG